MKPYSMPLKHRASFVWLGRGILRADSHCLLWAPTEGTDEGVEIPVGALVVILLEPGSSVTHEAAKMAAAHNTPLIWVGEGGVRTYASIGTCMLPERLLQQCAIHTVGSRRLAAARRLYELMFDHPTPPANSIEKLRGIEGAQVRKTYLEIARVHGIAWQSRDSADESLQFALGMASSCLSALCEAVVCAAGYSPAIGVVH